MVLNTVPLCILWRNVSVQYHDQQNNRGKQHKHEMPVSTTYDQENIPGGTMQRINDNYHETEKSAKRHIDRLHIKEMSARCNKDKTHEAVHVLRQKQPMQVQTYLQSNSIALDNREQQGTDRSTQGNINHYIEAGSKFSQISAPYSRITSMKVGRKSSAITEAMATNVIMQTANLHHQSKIYKKHSVGHNMLQILKNKGFAIFALGSILSNPCLIIATAFVVDIFLDKGFTKDDASLGLTLMFVTNIFGRLLPGFLMQNKHFPILGVPAITATSGTILFTALNFTRSRHLTIFLWAMLGVPTGVMISSYSVTSVALVGQELLPYAMGLLSTSFGIGTSIAGVTNGYIRDETSSYEVPLLVSAGITSLGLALFCIAVAVMRKDKHKNTR